MKQAIKDTRKSIDNERDFVVQEKWKCRKSQKSHLEVTKRLVRRRQKTSEPFIELNDMLKAWKTSE